MYHVLLDYHKTIRQILCHDEYNISYEHVMNISQTIYLSKVE